MKMRPTNLVILATTILLVTNILTAGLVSWSVHSNRHLIGDVQHEQAICAARLDGIIKRNQLSDIRQASMERLLLKNCGEK